MMMLLPGRSHKECNKGCAKEKTRKTFHHFLQEILNSKTSTSEDKRPRHKRRPKNKTFVDGVYLHTVMGCGGLVWVAKGRKGAGARNKMLDEN